MPITCKCGETHEAVPQAEFEKRVKTLTDQRTELKTQLAEVQSQYDAKEIEALRADRAELSKLRGDLEARDALSGAGFKADPKAVRLTRTLYEMATEGTEEAKRPTFGDWLKDDKGAGAEPTLAPLRIAQQGADKGAPKPPAQGGRKPGGGLPDPNQGATDPKGGRLSPQQLQEQLNRLPLAERAARAKELGFEVPAPGAPRTGPVAGEDGAAAA